MKPRASQISVDPTGLTVVTGTEVQTAIEELDAAVGSSGYTDEQVRDVIGAALVAGTNMTVTVNDPANTITLASTASGGTTYTPTVRASAIGTHNGTNTVSVTIPSTTVAGDLLLLLNADHFDATVPAGWRTLDRGSGSNMNGFVAYRYATASSASASQSVQLSGSEQGVLVCVVVQGAAPYTPVEQIHPVRSTSGSASITLGPMHDVTGALAIGFCGVRSSTGVTGSTGTSVLSNTTTDVATRVTQEVLGSTGDYSQTFSATGTTNGYYTAYLLVRT